MVSRKVVNYPTLYSKDKGGKVKEWNIYVENCGGHSNLIYSYGLVGGKQVKCTTTITEGKNTGKKNETSHFTQALADAQSKWNKKKDTGYTVVISEEQNEVLLPMLAQDYKKHSHKVKYPCYIQPKLDGYRMVYNASTKTLTSRTGKEFTILYDTELYSILKKSEVSLDGELYVHDASFPFENYGILRKTKNLTDEEKTVLNKIQYHIYDIIQPSMSYQQRWEMLQNLNVKSDKLCIVKTEQCNNVDDINNLHAEYVADGYEGSMVRNQNAEYIHKYRSYDLLKKKDFDDAEFTIVGFTSEKDTNGETDDMVMWICETTDKKRFNVQSKGTKEERKKIYKEASQYVGKQLWLQYFGLTVEGIPRFPKTMRNGVEAIRETKM
jgi:DNA ligase-1